MVICLERGADLHTAQLMPLPLTVSCFRKIQIGFTFLVPAHLGSPIQWAVKRVCVCVCAPRGRGGEGGSSSFALGRKERKVGAHDLFLNTDRRSLLSQQC